MRSVSTGNRYAWALACAGAFAFAVAVAACGQAQTAAVTPAPTSPPVSAWSRVIVTFRVAPAESEPERTAAIVRGREALLRELTSTSYRVNRAYETIPAVALEVSPEALRVLQQSPNVVAIDEDSLVAPT